LTHKLKRFLTFIQDGKLNNKKSRVVYGKGVNQLPFRRFAMYEVTFIDAGKTFTWTLKQCQEHFGVQEFKEYEAGYLPHVVVVKID
jgi:hypothetical protein